MHEEPPVYHRDIRRENIIKATDSDRWFLIDFADASAVPTKAVDHLSLDGHSPHIRDDGHGAEVDIWGVGHYMWQLRTVVNDCQKLKRWRTGGRKTSH